MPWVGASIGGPGPGREAGEGTDPAEPPGVADPTVAAVADAAMGGGRGPMSLLLLGIVLLVVGGGARWAQDVSAPYVNLGEADLPGPVEFEAEDATYRIVTSGPTRPPIERTQCTITRADGEVQRERGAEGVDGGQTRFGVTRVLEFRAVAGPTSVRCGYVTSPETGGGRMQVVAANGPVSLAATLLLAGGVAAIIGAIGWFVARFRGAQPSDPTPG